MLRRRSPLLGGAPQQKVSNCPDVPLPNIFAERPENVGGAASVMPQRGLLHPAMHPEPFTKGDHKSGVSGRVRCLSCADATGHEVPMEQLYSKVCVIANPGPFEMGASAA